MSAISSISSDLIVGSSPQPSEKIKKSSTVESSSPFKHVTFRGKTYAISLWSQEAGGRQTPLTLQAADSIEKVHTLVQQLLKAHENKAASVKDLTDPKWLDDDGLYFHNKKDPASHDFIIEDAVLAKALTAQLSTPERPLQEASIKAQDAWTAITQIVQTPAFAIGPSSPPPSQASTLSTKHTAPEAEQEKADQTAKTPPARTAPVTSAELDLQKARIDINEPNWFEKISSPFLKKRILENILKEEMPYKSPAERFYQQLCQTSDAPLNAVAELITPVQDEILKIQSAQPSSISAEIREMAEDIYELYCAPFHSDSYNTELPKKIDAFVKEEFDKAELYRYFREQAIAEGEEVGLITDEWCKEHLTEKTDRFIQSLLRWLDNSYLI